MQDKQGRTPLHAAACGGDVKVATCLLEGGADIEAIDKVRGGGRGGADIEAIDKVREGRG